MQLHALSKLLLAHPEYKAAFVGAQGGVRLVLIGGSRNDEDAARVEILRALARKLHVEVRFSILVLRRMRSTQAQHSSSPSQGGCLLSPGALQLLISGFDRLPDVLIVLRVPFSAVQEHVEFMINASYPAMLSYLERASVGLHTMVDEHFGISVVEFMVRFH